MKQLVMALAVVLAASAAGAQPYQIDWWTVDGGGAMNGTGGAYTLSGSFIFLFARFFPCPRKPQMPQSGTLIHSPP